MTDLLLAETEGRSSFDEELEIINSCRATAAERVESLSRLEIQLGRILLDDERRLKASDDDKKAWWLLQEKPHHCIAFHLTSLLHRLHLECKSIDSRDNAEQGDLISRQYISCFIILQGLCLKDKQSQLICARRSILELLIDIIDAKYWRKAEALFGVPAHAIDLLICITISSSQASSLVETLQGEEIIRDLMERQTLGESTSSSSRKIVTLDQLENNAVAVKCAEFLLFYEYEREEQGKKYPVIDHLIGDESSLISDTFRIAVKKNRRGKTSALETVKQSERVRRLQSPSPKKDRIVRESSKVQREERIGLMKNRPDNTDIQRSKDDDNPFQRTPVTRSPIKATPTSCNNKGHRVVSTPFTTKAASASPKKPKGKDHASKEESIRGRSRDRNPLSATQPSASNSSNNSSQSTLHISSTPSSPLKSLIGPSPAVQRAQARSVSPAKKRQNTLPTPLPIS